MFKQMKLGVKLIMVFLVTALTETFRKVAGIISEISVASVEQAEDVSLMGDRLQCRH